MQSSGTNIYIYISYIYIYIYRYISYIYGFFKSIRLDTVQHSIQHRDSAIVDTYALEVLRMLLTLILAAL